MINGDDDCCYREDGERERERVGRWAVSTRIEREGGVERDRERDKERVERELEV